MDGDHRHLVRAVSYLVWGALLLAVRWSALNGRGASSAEAEPLDEQGETQLMELLSPILADVDELQAALERFAASTFQPERVARGVDFAVLLDGLRLQANKIPKTDLSAREDQGANGDVNQDGTPRRGTHQEVHPADAFLFSRRVSTIPPMVTDELLCDQLGNTFPLFFGGEVSRKVVLQEWCRSGALGKKTFEHLPPGVLDAHLVHFTLVQVYRSLYLHAQFEDRLTRFRELFRPMIEAMESRHDRMLYNYI